MWKRLIRQSTSIKSCVLLNLTLDKIEKDNYLLLLSFIIYHISKHFNKNECFLSVMPSVPFNRTPICPWYIFKILYLLVNICCFCLSFIRFHYLSFFNKKFLKKPASNHAHCPINDASIKLVLLS